MNGIQKQGHLWGNPPLARKTDPDTSHEAADYMIESGKLDKHKALVLEALRVHPETTSRELADLMGAEDRYICSRRLSDLAHDELVERCEPRPCRITNRNATTWRVTK